MSLHKFKGSLSVLSLRLTRSIYFCPGEIVLGKEQALGARESKSSRRGWQTTYFTIFQNSLRILPYSSLYVLKIMPQECFVPNNFFNLFFKMYFTYLFLAVLGLRCCMQAFSSCSEQGLLLVVVRRLLVAMASLVVDHGLWARGLQ